MQSYQCVLYATVISPKRLLNLYLQYNSFFVSLFQPVESTTFILTAKPVIEQQRNNLLRLFSVTSFEWETIYGY